MEKVHTTGHDSKKVFLNRAPHLDYCRIQFADKMVEAIPEDVRVNFLEKFCNKHNAIAEFYSDETEDNVASARDALKAAGRARRKESAEVAIEILNSWGV